MDDIKCYIDEQEVHCQKLKYQMTNKQGVLIHCQPQLLPDIKELGLSWTYSPTFGEEEIDVIVDDIPYEIIDGTYQDPDEQLCEHYGINYDLVNCIEALY